MDYAILGLLLLLPHSIYQLKQSFARGLSLFFSDSLGGLRQALARLEQRGWVSSQYHKEGGRNQRVFSPTAQGSLAFYTWMLETDLGKDLETTALLKIFFLGHLEDPSQQKQVLEGILDEAKESLAILEAKETELKEMIVPPSFQKHFFWQAQTLHYGIGSHRWGLEWFRQLLKLWEREVNQP